MSRPRGGKPTWAGERSGWLGQACDAGLGLHQPRMQCALRDSPLTHPVSWFARHVRRGLRSLRCIRTVCTSPSVVRGTCSRPWRSGPSQRGLHSRAFLPTLSHQRILVRLSRLRTCVARRAGSRSRTGDGMRAGGLAWWEPPSVILALCWSKGTCTGP